MKIDKKKILLIGLSILATAIFFIIINAVISCRFPSDEQISEKWGRIRRNVFDLRYMLLREPKDIVGIGGQGVMFQEPWRQVPPEEAGMSVAAYKVFRKEMAKSGIVSIQKEHRGGASFSIRGCGRAGVGYRFAFVYLEEEPLGLLKNLNKIRPASGEYVISYLKLEENWYFRVVW